MENKQSLKREHNDLSKMPAVVKLQQVFKKLGALSKNISKSSTTVNLEHLSKEVKFYNKKFKELSKIALPKIPYANLPLSPEIRIAQHVEMLIDSNEHLVEKLSKNNKELVEKLSSANRLNKIYIGIAIVSVIVAIISFFVR